MREKALKIIIAGGGTGGHLFPGVAVARQFLAVNPESTVMFVGTGKPLEKNVLERYHFEHKTITAEGLKGRGVLRQARALMKLGAGLVQSLVVLARFKPELVVGMGGYGAAPVVMAAKIIGCPIVLCEQNIFPGITNRVLSRFARRVYVSFEKTPGIAPGKAFFSGNPLREEIRPAGKKSPRDPFTILVLGGSQGAHRINTAVLEAIDQMDNSKDMFFIHQTGPADENAIKEGYESRGISCIVRSFFDDMASVYQKAHLMVCRAGATSVAEITAMGKPAIFIPFPFAADNHQVLNARAVCDAGAGTMILEKELTGAVLSREISRLAGDRELLDEMAQKSLRLGRPDAARAIVDDCYEMISKLGKKKKAGFPKRGNGLCI